MALNPFFLQGSRSEQRLTQDLINEQLRMFGVDVTYIPRKFLETDNVLNEVQSSKFDDNFVIEAYVNTYEGYSGAGDILTKFGMSIKDEVILTISKERFEDFIAPFMGALNDGTDQSEIVLTTRPREGDLIFFPLGERLFEIKFVEHEDPFYQLGKNYVYQLKCELFEYEDEVIDTSIQVIDSQVKDDGYISTLQLIGVGQTAEATASIASGFISEIYLNNDGSGYTSPPTITISGGGGTGAAATCGIHTSSNGVVRVNMLAGGFGYSTIPNVTIADPVGAGITAVGIASIGVSGSNKVVKFIHVDNAGNGYTSTPIVTVADPDSMLGIGTYQFNEIVKGSRSGTEARVKNWDADTNILQVSNVGIGSTVAGFYNGEDIIGQTSGASYSVSFYNSDDTNDKYNSGDEFEYFGDEILDFTETNPFGVV